MIKICTHSALSGDFIFGFECIECKQGVSRRLAYTKYYAPESPRDDFEWLGIKYLEYCNLDKQR